MTRPTLITGATGFVGTAIGQSAHSGPTIRISRRGGVVGDRTVSAVDITDRRSLRSIARGVGSIIHCASYIGHDADLAELVNDGGTRVLIEVAAELNIKNITYISTTGVYGSGQHNGTKESAALAPTSDVSRSRRRAEQRVLDVGGSVIRPHLTYGAGDRWFIPRLIGAARLLGGLPRGVRTSTISVDTLAEQAWMLREHTEHHGGGIAYNARHDLSVTLQDIMRAYQAALSHTTVPSGRVDTERARTTLIAAGLSRHQVDMLTRPNWFTSKLPPPNRQATIAGRFNLSPSAIAWYRDR